MTVNVFVSFFVLSPAVTVAVTVVVPTFFAVSCPAFVTDATLGFDEVYVTVFVTEGVEETESLAVFSVFPPT